LSGQLNALGLDAQISSPTTATTPAPCRPILLGVLFMAGQ
jgi:hypothetical protein